MTQEKKVEPKHAAKSDDRSKDQKERRPKDLPSTKVKVCARFEISTSWDLFVELWKLPNFCSVLWQVVVRRLPSSLTAEQFLEVISPVPEYNYFNFKSDPTWVDRCGPVHRFPHKWMSGAAYQVSQVSCDSFYSHFVSCTLSDWDHLRRQGLTWIL